MKITEYSVRNPAFTIVAFVFLVFLGVGAFLHIPRSEDPLLSIPTYLVIVVYPGATPTDLEKLVVRPVEDSMKELEDIKKLRADIRDGVAVVTVEFRFGTDVDKKYDDVLRQVNIKRPSLPSDILSIEVRRVQTVNVAVQQTALVSADASYARLQDLAEDLRKRWETVPGVRNTDRWAFPAKQVRVSLDIAQLSRLKIPLSRVLEAIQSDNALIPGGAVEVADRRLNLKTSGNYTSLDQVRMTPVGSSGNASIYLKDVADVTWTYEDKDYIGRFNGERAVFVTATMMRGTNIFDIRKGLGERTADFVPTLPADVRLETGFEQAENVELRLTRLEHDFLLAFGLVLITVLPLGFRSSLLVLVSIPLSLALGLAMLNWFGFSLNQLSIVGCVIALGLLVDDSIVVVENIARFRRLGHPPKEAAILATRQIAVAVLGTTATLLFAFLPLLMLPEGAGQFIRSLPAAVVFTVLASLLVALTIIPFLASVFLTGHEDPEGNFLLRAMNRLIHGLYRPVLHWCMRHRITTVLASALLFAVSLTLVPRIGFSLFPKAGTPQFLIRVTAAEGAGVNATDALVRRVEDILKRTPEVRNWFANVGKGNPQIYYNLFQLNQKANTGEIFCSLKEYNPRTTPALMDRLRKEVSAIPGAEIVVKEFENGPPIEAPIAIRVIGEDLSTLAMLSAQVEALLQATPGAENVNNPVRVQRTDLQVRLDKPMLALLGVPEAEADRAVRLAFAGINAGKFREADGDEYNIQVALPRGDRADLSNWPHIQVPSATGSYIPIGQLATLDMASAPAVIQRLDRQRLVTVTAYTATGFNTDKVTESVRSALKKLSLPVGYRVAFGGEVESRSESFAGFGDAILIAVFGILAILVIEFRSFRGTLIVASVIPLGVVGGLVGLWFTGYTLSFMAIIGFIALIGIEIKNSILLVDFTNQLRAEGVPLDEAIERAGETRFLPVVLTTFTALGALMPLALQGSAFYSPLAIVIIGGLLSSLLLCRLVTPVMYRLLPPDMKAH